MNPATVAAPKSGMNINMDINNNVQNLLDQSGIFAFIHVDDLASAHILTYQADRAAGRYICFQKLVSKVDIVEATRQMYPIARLASFNPCMLEQRRRERYEEKGKERGARDKILET